MMRTAKNCDLFLVDLLNLLVRPDYSPPAYSAKVSNRPFGARLVEDVGKLQVGIRPNYVSCQKIVIPRGMNKDAYIFPYIFSLRCYSCHSVSQD